VYNCWEAEQRGMHNRSLMVVMHVTVMAHLLFTFKPCDNHPKEEILPYLDYYYNQCTILYYIAACLLKVEIV
jgi:hypothetical protein